MILNSEKLQMNNPKLFHPQVPNFTFFEKWYENPHSQEPFQNGLSENSPNKKSDVNGEMSFCKSNAESQEKYTPPGLLKGLENQPRPYLASSQSLVRPKISSCSKEIVPIPIVLSNKNHRLSSHSSKQLETIVNSLEQEEKTQKQLDERMREVPLIEMHVSDIRKRMRSYHPICNFDGSANVDDMSFMELSRQVMQELKNDRKTQKLTAQLKLMKHQNIDKMFEDIREESNRKIKDALDQLKLIKKQDSYFHQKVTDKFEELEFLKKDLIQGFDNLCLKGNLDHKQLLRKKLETKIFKTCKHCKPKEENQKPECIGSKLKLAGDLSSPLSAPVGSFRQGIRTEESPDKIKIPDLFPSIPSINQKRKTTNNGTYTNRSSSVRRLRSMNHPYNLEERLKRTNKNEKNFPLKPLDLLRCNSESQCINIRSCTEITNSGGNEGLVQHKRGGSIPSNLSRNESPVHFRDEKEKRKIEVNKIIETSQAMPEKCFIRLLKLSSLNDTYLLKFTAACSTFELEIKLNDTIEADFARKCGRKQSSYSNDIFSSAQSKHQLSSQEFEKKIKTENCFQSSRDINLGIMDRSIEIDKGCQECLSKLEGMKFGLQHFQEIDGKAIELEADYMESLLSKLTEVKDQGDLEIKSSLKEACNKIEVFLESCFDIAPAHAVLIEKLFKILLFFFELKIRKYIQSQSLLLNEIEEGNVYLKHKKKLFDQLSKLEEDNTQLIQEMQFVKLKAKENKNKYKEHVRSLIEKIEELRGSHLLSKESDSTSVRSKVDEQTDE